MLISQRTLKGLPVTAAVLAVAIVAASCGRAKDNKPKTRNKPVSFDEALIASITPTSDGGAYAMAYDSGLWYLRGTEAIKVTFVGVPTNSVDRLLLSSEVTPLIGGGAYAEAFGDRSLWYLHEGVAVRVTEVAKLSTPSASGPVNAFHAYVAERAKRLKAERELEDRPSSDDGSE